ncbi:MAG: sigma-70 family RNA polymerase sigma factor [Candidatus Omnitrophota bacterium]
MTLCQECINNGNTCKGICKALKKEITGRGKTAALKPKTYPVDMLHIEDAHQDLNDFQLKVLYGMAEFSATTKDDLANKIDVNEAIDVGLNENEKRVVRLFMDGYKQDEIAESLGVSQPRANFLLKRALRKLKNILS